MKSKKGLITVVVIVVIVLAFPISNLIFKPAVSTTLTDAKKGDAAFTKAAEVLQKKCFACHAGGADLPFYAGFPIAGGLIQKDITTGIEHFNLVGELLPEGDKPASEVALAKLEHSIETGTMPPGRYRMMHWDAGLSQADKDAIIEWVRGVRRKHYATPGVPAEVAGQALQPLPKTIALNSAKVALGKKLYHDKRLSGDETLSCASCHDLAKGGTDRLPVSVGIRGQKGGINAPTTYNSGYQFLQFWDGRAADLQEQAAGPVANPIEMGAQWPDVVDKLKKDADLVKEVKAVYPAGISRETVTDAIAEFERSLITPNSRFDKFLGGDAGALSDDEKKGYDLFRQHGCHTCHAGKILGGRSFEKMGREGDYFKDRGKPTEADNGRFNVTKNEADRHKFKVPTLRNIAQTGPYFHDGSTTSIEEAVKKMAKYQQGVTLSDTDAGLIAAFLRTLTGEYEGKLLE